MTQLSGETAAADAGAVVSRSCRVADVDVRAFLGAHDPPRIHWADPDGLAVSGVGAAARVTAAGDTRFEAIRERAAALFAAADHDGPDAARPRLLGGFAFLDGHKAGGAWPGFPAAEFVLPAVQVTRRDGDAWLTVTQTGVSDPATVEDALADARERLKTLPDAPADDALSGDSPPGVEDTTATPGADGWRDQVEQVVDRIRSGDLRKVALATALRADLADDVDGPALLGRLGRRYPECFRFFVEPTGDAAFLGATPERLASLRDDAVRTTALAGSVGRGDTPEADAELAARLRGSEKLRHEQQLVVEDIVARLRDVGDVAVGDRGVRRLSNIQHLETPITAAVSEGTHVLDVVEALHPTPAVGGLPADAALDTIREAEGFDRGWYAAPVGWFDAAGDGAFAVGIRSAVVADRDATVFAGNGIVADSDPEAEYEEVQLKYRPVLDELE